MSFDYLKFTI